MTAPRHELGKLGEALVVKRCNILSPVSCFGFPTGKDAIYYLSADVQRPDIFKPRQPLSATARLTSTLAGARLTSHFVDAMRAALGVQDAIRERPRY
jgi:hypothetical protein